MKSPAASATRLGPAWPPFSSTSTTRALRTRLSLNAPRACVRQSGQNRRVANKASSAPAEDMEKPGARVKRPARPVLRLPESRKRPAQRRAVRARAHLRARPPRNQSAASSTCAAVAPVSIMARMTRSSTSPTMRRISSALAGFGPEFLCVFAGIGGRSVIGLTLQTDCEGSANGNVPCTPRFAVCHVALPYQQPAPLGNSELIARQLGRPERVETLFAVVVQIRLAEQIRKNFRITQCLSRSQGLRELRSGKLAAANLFHRPKLLPDFTGQFGNGLAKRDKFRPKLKLLFHRHLRTGLVLATSRRRLAKLLFRHFLEELVANFAQCQGQIGDAPHLQNVQFIQHRKAPE